MSIAAGFIGRAVIALLIGAGIYLFLTRVTLRSEQRKDTQGDTKE